MEDVEHSIMSHAKDHKLLLMVFGSVVVSILLVLASLALYYSTGASQLDLSRPGYSDIREQVRNNDDYKGFNAAGPINEESLEEFDKLYTEKLKEIEAVDAFGNDVLSFESLELE